MFHFENVFIKPFTVGLSNTTPSQKKEKHLQLEWHFQFLQSVKAGAKQSVKLQESKTGMQLYRV